MLCWHQHFRKEITVLFLCVHLHGNAHFYMAPSFSWLFLLIPIQSIAWVTIPSKCVISQASRGDHVCQNMERRYLRRIALELTQVPIFNSEYVAEFKVRDP